MGDQIVAETRVEEAGDPRDGEVVQVAAHQHVGVPPQADGLADEAQLAPSAADLFAELRVRVAGQAGVAFGVVVQDQRVHAARRAGELAQRLEVKPHDARDAALVEEEFGREEKGLHGDVVRM